MQEFDSEKPIVRKRIRSVHIEPKSGYPPSLRTWGIVEVIQVKPPLKMAERLAAAFLLCKDHLKKQGVVTNAPEIFPVNDRECLVLVTGWKPETIVLNS